MDAGDERSNPKQGGNNNIILTLFSVVEISRQFHGVHHPNRIVIIGKKKKTVQRQQTKSEHDIYVCFRHDFACDAPLRRTFPFTIYF